MPKLRRVCGLLAAVVLAFGAVGCGGGSTSSSSGTGSGVTKTGAVASEEFSPTVEVDLSAYDLDSVVVGDDSEGADANFEAPTFDELNSSTTWVDMPVVDPIKLLKELKDTVEAPGSDALGLPNDTAENNDKLVAAYGVFPESDDDVDYNATLTLMVPNDAKSVNPILISSSVEMEVTGLTGFGIFGFDRGFNPFALADVASSWKTSEDRKVDLVVLRDDLTWSDGKPITAQDVAFSFHTIMDDEVPVPAVRSGTDELLDVVAYDDRTVAYFHKKPLATNVWNVNFPVIPKHVYEESLKEDKTLATSDYHVELERNPVAGGPYTIASRTRNQDIVLERRESWHMHDGKQVRKKPNFKTIRYKIMADPNTALLAMKKGELDYMLLSPQQWNNQTLNDEFYGDNTKLYGPEWGFAYVGWNNDSPFFNDVRVRRAMSYVLNYDALINDICYGLYKQGQGIYAPDAWMAPDPMPQPFIQDLDAAESLLTEAGWEDHDGDGFLDKEIDGKSKRFEFSLVFANGSTTTEQIALLLKENLDQIGITCNLKPTEYTVLQSQARDHTFDAMLAAWGTGADPDTSTNLWTTAAIDEGGRNFVNFRSEDVDKLFELGKREFDREKRGRIYAKIHSILWNEQPYTWLYYRTSFVGLNKDLRGITFSPRDPFGFSGGLEGLWKPKKK